MDPRSAGDCADRRETALSLRACQLCGGRDRYARWLRTVEREVCRACAVAASGACAPRTIEVRIQNDPIDDTSSAAMWADVRHLAVGLALRYGTRLTPIRLADAVVFRIVANPAAASAGPEQGAGWLGTWLRRRTRSMRAARPQI
jgi:hypothetical protein